MRRIRVMQSFGQPRPTTNPYIVMLRDALVASEEIEHVPFGWRSALGGRYDVLHVHWADTLLSGRRWWTRAGKRVAFAALLLRLRLGRIAVVRTVHNVDRPEGRGVDLRLASALERRADLEIHLTSTTPATPGVPFRVIPHGHYREWFAAMPRAERIPGRLAYVGLIKPYKGVETLVAAFATAREERADLTLSVAGSAKDPGLRAHLEQAAAATPGLSIDLRYVSEHELVRAVTAAQLVVLPYRNMHNSGALLAALSLDRPTLVPENPTTLALAEEVGPGWVSTFTGDLSADDLLAATEDGRRPSGTPDLDDRDWTAAGARHAAAYRSAIEARRRSGARRASSDRGDRE